MLVVLRIHREADIIDSDIRQEAEMLDNDSQKRCSTAPNIEERKVKKWSIPTDAFDSIHPSIPLSIMLVSGGSKSNLSGGSSS